MTTGAPRQLTEGDAIFLAMETPESGGHVGALMILDPFTREGLEFERLRDHVVERMTLVPRFTWKLQEVPFGLDRPYWVEAEDFEVAQHVIRTAVPAPGSMEQVTALVGRLHAQPIDRSRPMWEIWVIEGLENGRVALYTKIHHALVDGSGGSGLGEVLADLTPEATGPPIVPEAFNEDAPAKPGIFDVATRAARNAVRRPFRMASHLRNGARGLLRGESDGGITGEVPRLSFNRGIGRRRALATTSIDLERVRELTKHFDVKVNDVVLEVVGSALRRWLRDRGESPEQPLVAMCPVSTRTPGEYGPGNEITSMAVSLATDIADPIERLRGIHKSSQRAKQGVARGSFDYIAALGESLTPAGVNLLVRASSLSSDNVPLPGNLVVSNVRATPMPLYLAGAKIESLMPISMLAVGQGLNVTLVSYCDRIDIGILVDPDLVPDAGDLAERFPLALEELATAAQGVVHRAR